MYDLKTLSLLRSTSISCDINCTCTWTLAWPS